MKKAIIAFVATATAAQAHTGHEAAVTQGEAHWLTQGDHLAVLALAGLVVGFALRPLLARMQVRQTRKT